MKYTALLIACVATAAAAAPSHRIAGGHEATEGQFPWLVTIEVTNFESTWLLCGGVLISSQWVLTAAHCLDSEKPAWLAVRSGDHRRGQAEGTEQLHYVDAIAQHPDYIHYLRPYVNDVGLVHLSRPATLDAHTQLAPLRSHITPLSGWCREAGWGEAVVGQGISETLRYADVLIQPLGECEAAYASPHDPHAVCAGSQSGGVGFCAGDNGGGLVCWDGISERYVVSAILSWREGCAHPGKPAVYMDVAPYRAWVMSVVSQAPKG